MSEDEAQRGRFRDVLRIGASLLAVVTIGAMVWTVAARGDTESSPFSLKLRITDESTAQIDEPPDGISVGDQTLSAGHLVSMSGEEVGRIISSCIVIDSEQFQRSQCHQVLEIDGKGTVTVHGSKFAFPPPQALKVKYAITGGTGCFQEARGEVVSAPWSSNLIQLRIIDSCLAR